MMAQALDPLSCGRAFQLGARFGPSRMHLLRMFVHGRCADLVFLPPAWAAQEKDGWGPGRAHA